MFSCSFFFYNPKQSKGYGRGLKFSNQERGMRGHFLYRKVKIQLKSAFLPVAKGRRSDTERIQNFGTAEADKHFCLACLSRGRTTWPLRINTRKASKQSMVIIISE
jgi:hypothetical protein